MRVEPAFKIVPGLPYEEYAKHPGVRASLLSDVHHESLRTVKAKIDGKISQESDALDFGEAFHSLLLENKREFVEQPATYPGKDGDKPWTYNANFCKEWRAEQTKTVLTRKEIESLVGMVESVKESEVFPHLSGQKELSIFATKDEQPLSIRIDLIPDLDNGPVIDFKKARSADPEEFVKQAWRLGYHMKAAFYLDVLKLAGIVRNEFWFVAVEQEYPFNLSIVKMFDTPCSFISAGRRQYRAAFKKLMNAQKSGHWPSYGTCHAEDHATAWMAKELEA